MNSLESSVGLENRNFKDFTWKERLDLWRDAKISTRVRFEEVTGEYIEVIETMLIAEVIENDLTLTELNLSNGRITSSGIELIAIALKANTTIKHVNLSHNIIGDTGARLITNLLKSGCTFLT